MMSLDPISTMPFDPRKVCCETQAKVRSWLLVAPMPAPLLTYDSLRPRSHR